MTKRYHLQHMLDFKIKSFNYLLTSTTVLYCNFLVLKASILKCKLSKQFLNLILGLKDIYFRTYQTYILKTSKVIEVACISLSLKEALKLFVQDANISMRWQEYFHIRNCRLRNLEERKSQERNSCMFQMKSPHIPFSPCILDFVHFRECYYSKMLMHIYNIQYLHL